MRDAVFQREGQRNVAFDQRQFAAEPRHVGARFQPLAHGAASVVKVFVNAVNRLELLEQGRAGLFADALHAGDVVGTVAHQAFQLDQLPGLQAVLVAEGLQSPDDVLLAAAPWQLHADALRQQLQDVAVAGDDAQVEVFIRDEAHHGADDVIGLVAFLRQHGNVEGLHHFLDALDLRPQLVGHLFARALVVAVEFLAAAESAVETHGQVLRLFPLQDVQQGAREAVGGVGGFAGAGAEGLHRQGEVLPVGQGVAVDDDETVSGSHAAPEFA